MSVMDKMKAPFPYFGGKSAVADVVWQRFGAVKQYIEPFCGSASMLLSAPSVASLEVIGDANYFVANFWRCVRFQPDAVWSWQDYPVVHSDLCARHRWLTEPQRTAELVAALDDPEWTGDPKIAGWWLWGQCCWIGSGWCVPDNRPAESSQIPHVSNAGMGIQAYKLSADGDGELSPHRARALDWLRQLSRRLERVRVINGTWSRCLNHNYGGAQTAVFLDPPYKGFIDVYGAQEIAAEVEAWAYDHGDIRVAICGHVGDYDLPGWDTYEWSRGKLTYSSNKTTESECIWFSPACMRPSGNQVSIFG